MFSTIGCDRSKCDDLDRQGVRPGVASAVTGIKFALGSSGTGCSLGKTSSTGMGVITPLRDIVITETAAGDSPLPRETTLVFSAHTGFEFQAATGTATVDTADVTVNRPVLLATIRV